MDSFPARSNRFADKVPEKRSDSSPMGEGKDGYVGRRKFSIGSFLRGEFLADESTLRHLPFVLFLSLLGLVYIANAYYVERKMVAIQHVSKRVKDLHTHYVSVKADLMYEIKQTEIASDMAETGLKESVTPPKVLKVNKSDLAIY
jgi:hypothetical protein